MRRVRGYAATGGLSDIGKSLLIAGALVLCPVAALADPIADAWSLWPGHDAHEVVTSWAETTSTGAPVFGFRLKGDEPADIYLTADGVPLTDDERTLLGIVPKRWDRLKTTTIAKAHPATVTALPKRTPRVYTGSNTHDPVLLPPLDRGALALEDATAAKGALRTGAFQDLQPPIAWAADGATDGEWQTLPNGTRIWSVAIAAPGAHGLRLHLANVYLPPGVTLTVYPAGDPASALGPYAQSNLPDGEGWLATVFSDTVVLECVVPNYVDPVGLYGVVDRVINHYVDVDALIAKQVAGGCNLDVSCYSDYADAANAVAGLATIGTNGSLWCTGTLIADVDAESEIPYFLTAFHCVSGQNGSSHSASNVELFWFYQASSCGGAVPPVSTVPRTTGGLDFIAGNSTGSGTDFSLLRMRSTPPNGAWYLGWSAVPQPVGTAVTGIHHPSGSYKRISFGAITNTGHSGTGNRLQPIERFHETTWANGTTEPGSSGSPILLPGTKELVGQLWGGYASCLALAEPDYYGRMDKTYAIVERYLDPKAVLPPEDIDGSGQIDATDVQIVINAALGITQNPACDVNGSGEVDAIDIQQVINAVLIGV